MNNFLNRISIEVVDSFKRLVAKDENGFRQLWIGCAVRDGFDDDKYDVYRPELWTPRITRYMKQKLYAARFFKDYSADVVNADTVHIPHISDSSGTIATDIPVTSGEVVAVSVNETKTDLVVDAWKGGAIYITKFEQREIMKRPNVMNEYAKWLGYRCARNAEIAILSNLLSLTASAGSTGTDLYSTNLETAFGILESNSVPKEDCRIFLKPKVYWDDIMSIQKYYDASQFGRATVPKGAHDMLYGVPIVLTSNVPALAEPGGGVGNAIVHKDAIAFAMMGPDFIAAKGEHLRRKIIADVMYGDIILQKTWGVSLHSTN